MKPLTIEEMKAKREFENGLLTFIYDNNPCSKRSLMAQYSAYGYAALVIPIINDHIVSGCIEERRIGGQTFFVVKNQSVFENSKGETWARVVIPGMEESLRIEFNRQFESGYADEFLDAIEYAIKGHYQFGESDQFCGWSFHRDSVEYWNGDNKTLLFSFTPYSRKSLEEELGKFIEGLENEAR